MKKIFVTQSSLPDINDFINEIKSIWDSKCLTNMGEKHKLLESSLLQYLQVPNITLFSNGHLALEAAIDALELSGEVITTPFTFVSTTHAIVRKGLTPVFCDINPIDYTIDVKKIENLITSKTTAIIPVHVYGNICELSEIKKIGEKYNLKVIYDAAHAFGVKVNGKGIGTFGDASMFSFHATKVFNTIEGGAVSYSNNLIKKTLDNQKNFGISGPEVVESIGGNSKMNEFQAAMGICNLRNIDFEITKREEVANRYFRNLGNVKGIKLKITQANVRENYSYFPVLFEGYKKSRDIIFQELEENNIYARKYFYPIVSALDCYKNKYNAQKTPIAKYVSERILTLPMYSSLEMDEVDRICNIILK